MLAVGELLLPGHDSQALLPDDILYVLGAHAPHTPFAPVYPASQTQAVFVALCAGELEKLGHAMHCVLRVTAPPPE